MQNPFTSTYSKAPEYTYIFTEGVGEITENFSYDNPSESVYKITGVRGSGKTVMLAKIEEELQKDYNTKKGWIVCRISPNRDMLSQLGTVLTNYNIGHQKNDYTEINLSLSVLGTGGGIGVSKTTEFRDPGIEIEEMLKTAKKKGLKIYIGIDEISKNKEVIGFVAEFGKWLRANYPVYLVCTGLYENIQELSNVKNLTFFRRATTVQTTPLNFVRMTEMYKEKLNVGADTAKKMSDATKGYAYAFQELGVISFKNIKDFSLEEVIKKTKIELFSYSYEKIWEELSEQDRYFIKCLSDRDEYKREEVLDILGEKAGMYSVYRDRMLKRGLVTARYSYLGLALPFFGEYVREYCMYDGT